MRDVGDGGGRNREGVGGARNGFYPRLLRGTLELYLFGDLCNDLSMAFHDVADFFARKAFFCSDVLKDYSIDVLAICVTSMDFHILVDMCRGSCAASGM